MEDILAFSPWILLNFKFEISYTVNFSLYSLLSSHSNLLLSTAEDLLLSLLFEDKTGSYRCKDC